MSEPKKTLTRDELEEKARLHYVKPYDEPDALDLDEDCQMSHREVICTMAAFAESLIKNAATAPPTEVSEERKALKSIADLGVYCCDSESLGHECEAVRIARETLGLDVYSNRWGAKDE